MYYASGEYMYFVVRSADLILEAQQLLPTTSAWLKSDRPVPMNKWWHLILNCVSSLKLYFDGVLIAEGAAKTITYSTGDKEFRMDQGAAAKGSYRGVNIFGRGQDINYLLALRNTEQDGSSRPYFSMAMPIVPYFLSPYSTSTRLIVLYNHARGYLVLTVYSFYTATFEEDETAPVICKLGYIYNGFGCVTADILAIKSNRRAFSYNLGEPITYLQQWTMEAWILLLDGVGTIMGLVNPTDNHHFELRSNSNIYSCQLYLSEKSHVVTTATQSGYVTCPTQNDRRWFHLEIYFKLTSMDMTCLGGSSLLSGTYTVTQIDSGHILNTIVLGTSYLDTPTTEVYLKNLRVWNYIVGSSQILSLAYNDIPDPEHCLGLLSSMVFQPQGNDFTFREGAYGRKECNVRIVAQNYATSDLAEAYIITTTDDIVGDIFLPPMCQRGMKMNVNTLICEEASEMTSDMRSLELGKISVSLPYSSVSNAPGDYTMSFWLKIYSGSGASLKVITQAVANPFELIYNSIASSLALNPVRQTDIVSLSGLSLISTWTHIAIVNNQRSLSSSGLLFYLNLNPTPAASVGASVAIPSSDFLLFSSPINAVYGKIREFNLWALAIDYLLLNKFAYQQISKSYIDSGKLLMLFRLNEGEAKVIYDTSTGKNGLSVVLSTGSLKEHELWTSDNDLIVCGVNKRYYSDPGSCKGSKSRAFYKTASATTLLGPFSFSGTQLEGITVTLWVKLKNNPNPSVGDVLCYASNLFSIQIASGSTYSATLTYQSNTALTIKSSASYTVLLWQPIILVLGQYSFSSYLVFENAITYISSPLAININTLQTSLSSSQLYIGHGTAVANCLIAHVKVYSQYKSPDEASQGIYRTYTDFYQEPDLALYVPLDESQGSSFIDWANFQTYTFAGLIDTWEEDTIGKVFNSESVTLVKALSPTSSSEMFMSMSKPVLSLFGDSARTHTLTSDFGVMVFQKEFTIQFWCKITTSLAGTFPFLQTATPAFSFSAVISANPDITYRADFLDSTSATIDTISSLSAVSISSWSFISLSKYRIRIPSLVDRFVLTIGGAGSGLVLTNIQTLDNSATIYDIPSFSVINAVNQIGLTIFLKELRLFNAGRIDAELLRFSRVSGLSELPYLQFYYQFSANTYNTFYFNSYSTFNYMTQVNPSLTSGSSSNQGVWSNDDSFPHLCLPGTLSTNGICTVATKAFDLRTSSNCFSFTISSYLTEFTIEFWLYSIQLQAVTSTIVSTSDVISIMVLASKYQCNIGGGVPLQGGSITLNSWRHIACAQNDQTICSKVSGGKCGYLLLDNAVVDAASSYASLTSPGANIVAVNDATNPYKGLLRELKIWKRYRSPGTIMRYQRSDLDPIAEQNFILAHLTLQEYSQSYAINRADWSTKFASTSFSWAEPVSPLILCPMNQHYYDSSASNYCTLLMKVISISGASSSSLTFPISFSDSAEHFTIKLYFKVLSLTNTISIKRGNHFEILLATGGALTFSLLKTAASGSTVTSDVLTTTSGTSYTLNKWHYLSFAYSYYLQSYQIVILDLETSGATPVVTLSTSYTFRSGTGDTGLILQINGASCYLRELTLWDKYYPEPISLGKTLAGLRFNPASQPDLILYYKFDESSGYLLMDHSIYSSVATPTTVSSSFVSWVYDTALPDSLYCTTWHEIAIGSTTSSPIRKICGKSGPCSTYCDSCLALTSASYICTSCLRGSSYLLYNYQCQAANPIGAFPDNGEFKDCRHHCQTCTDKITCSVCIPPYYLHLTTGFCISSCPMGTCPSLDNTKCFEDVGCELLLAELYNDWTKISIKFSKNIDGSVLPSGITTNTQALCDYWFDPYTISLFGTGYVCSYQGQNVTVILGTDAAFTSTSKITVINNRMYLSSCGCPVRGDLSVNAHSVELKVLIDYSTTPYNHCEAAFIKISFKQGYGNRPSRTSYVYAFMSGVSTDPLYPRESAFKDVRESISMICALETSSLLKIPGQTFVSNGTYKLLISVKNFLGEIVDTEVSLTTAAPAVPRIEILKGVSQIWTQANSLTTISSAVVNENCLINLDGITLEWSQPGGSGVNKITNLPSFIKAASCYYFIIPAYTLLPEATYVLMAKATNTPHANELAPSTIVIKVKKNRVLAIISGGSRLVSSSSDLLLDASQSKDILLDISANETEIMFFEWICRNATTNYSCLFANRTEYNLNRHEMSFYIPSKDLSSLIPEGASSQVIRIFLHVSYLEAFDDTFVDITITNEPSILPVGIAVSSLRVNYNEIVILKCNINASETLRYSMDASYFLFNWTLSPPLEQSAAIGWDTPYLKIYERQLDYSTTHTAVCSVSYQKYPNAIVAQSSVTLFINRPPTSPNLVVYPTEGWAGSTNFIFFVTHTTDDDTPLRYQYFYYISEGKNALEYVLPLSDITDKAVYNTTLPVGGGDKSEIDIRVRVYDSYNASSKDVVATISVKSCSCLNTTESLLNKINAAQSVYELNSVISGNASSITLRNVLNKIVALFSSSENVSPADDTIAIRLLSLFQSYLQFDTEDLALWDSVLNQIVKREEKRINEVINSIEEVDLYKKKVNTGLSQEACSSLLNLYSFVISQNRSLSEENEKSIVTIARSFLKDAIVGENSTYSTPAFSVNMLKLSQCQLSENATEERLQEEVLLTGQIVGCKYYFNKCLLIPWRKNYYARPYDLVIITTDPSFRQKQARELEMKFLSNITSFYLFDDTLKEAIEPRNLSRNFTLEIYFQPGSVPSSDYVECVSRDSFGQSTFSDSSNGTLHTFNSSTPQFVRCVTNHFSDYSIIFQDASQKYLFSGCFWILIGLIVASVILLIWSGYKDREEEKNLGRVLDRKTAEVSIEKDTMNSRPPSGELPSTSGKASNTDLIVLKGTRRVEEISVAKYMDLEREETEVAEQKQMSVIQVLWMVFLRTHNLVKIFAFYSPHICRKSRSTLLLNKVFIPTTILLSWKFFFPWIIPDDYMISLYSVILAFPLLWLIELLVRCSILSSAVARLPATDMKIIDLQRAIYEKMAFRNKIRIIGRALSYTIMLVCFTLGVNMIYFMEKSMRDQLHMYMIVQYAYLLVPHQILCFGIQIVLIMVLGRKREDHEGANCAKKLVLYCVLKEILEAFKGS